ncbi:MAG TPA: class I SAM-dependent methyltransferase [Candidatus Eisenbacteria bacterium]|nr:class I SAM-dependent methyltransferase [Candidatus Eisenbacteria bacterium]
MNALEHFCCSTSLWRHITHNRLLPWVISGAGLGDHVLELGAGYGAATGQLLKLASQVTSLEYDQRALARLKARNPDQRITAIRGDASALPFADQSFSSAIAILMLHHLKSSELQDRALAEAYRVLRPGGSFFVFEINDSWMNRLTHVRSVFTPLIPSTSFARLTAAGFARVTVDFRTSGFRIRARKAASEPAKPDLPAARSATA